MMNDHFSTSKLHFWSLFFQQFYGSKLKFTGSDLRVNYGFGSDPKKGSEPDPKNGSGLNNLSVFIEKVKTSKIC